MRRRRTLFSERAAVAFAFRELKLAVEPSGAVALAALLAASSTSPARS
jgi:threonine dehydratase